jgi:hypothetical protein
LAGGQVPIVSKNASYARLLLKRFLYARLIQYATYMHFYIGKILSLQKVGVTSGPAASILPPWWGLG